MTDETRLLNDNVEVSGWAVYRSLRKAIPEVVPKRVRGRYLLVLSEEDAEKVGMCRVWVCAKFLRAITSGTADSGTLAGYRRSARWCAESGIRCLKLKDSPRDRAGTLFVCLEDAFEALIPAANPGQLDAEEFLRRLYVMLTILVPALRAPALKRRILLHRLYRAVAEALAEVLWDGDAHAGGDH